MLAVVKDQKSSKSSSPGTPSSPQASNNSHVGNSTFTSSSLGSPSNSFVGSTSPSSPTGIFSFLKSDKSSPSSPEGNSPVLYNSFQSLRSAGNRLSHEIFSSTTAFAKNKEQEKLARNLYRLLSHEDEQVREAGLKALEQVVGFGNKEAEWKELMMKMAKNVKIFFKDILRHIKKKRKIDHNWHPWQEVCYINIFSHDSLQIIIVLERVIE